MGFMLVATRVGGFMAGCPAFFPEVASKRFRTWSGLVLAFALYASLPQLHLPSQPYLAMLMELAYGLVMGLSVRLSILAVYFAGELVDLNAGYNFSQQVNPLTLEQTGPFAHLSQLMGGLLFFAVGGQHQVIMGLATSLKRVPVGTVPWRARTVTLLIEHTTELFVQGLRIAAPLLAALIATQIFLALLSRVAPQLNIWGVGFAAIAAMAGASFYAFTPAWVEYVCAIWSHTSANMLTLWSI
jgi:flagellar biosynthetic protein FliR